MKAQNYKKPLQTRLGHFLFLLPFLPALRPLLVNFHLFSTLIYGLGMAIILTLIIIANRQPLLVAEERGLRLNLHYRHSAEFHPYDRILSFRRRGKRRIVIESLDHKPVSLTLAKLDTDRLIKILEQKNIHVRNTAPISS
ncbi:MAG: hypothetical protein MI717_11465 [Spirochaetales bacterium]|nr:hypothetical protein [Spirochaetales bacterium]